MNLRRWQQLGGYGWLFAALLVFYKGCVSVWAATIAKNTFVTACPCKQSPTVSGGVVLISIALIMLALLWFGQRRYHRIKP